MKEIIEKRTGLKLQQLPKGAKHEVGKTYYCGYWNETYEVVGYNDNTGDWRGWEVACIWGDGKITKHCTALDSRKDFIVIK